MISLYNFEELAMWLRRYSHSQQDTGLHSCFGMDEESAVQVRVNFVSTNLERPIAGQL